MYKFILTLFLIPVMVYGQNKGIKFYEDLTWEQALAKAKAENKYIFLDCYTSWCGPCEIMSRTTFKDDSVGILANENFIPLKIQFDEDPEANLLKKEWYVLSKEFVKKYDVSAYPTILFFNSNGDYVHKSVGLKRTPKFLDILKKIKNKEHQYYTLLSDYKKDTTNIKTLYHLIYASKDADGDTQDLIKRYLNIIKNIDSKQDAQLILDVTHSSKDFSFGILNKERNKINDLLGLGITVEQLRRIVNYELAEYKLFKSSSIGKSIIQDNPDWSIIETDVRNRFSDNSQDYIDYIKLNFFMNAFQWDNFIVAFNNYKQKYSSSISDNKKKEYAIAIANYVNDNKLVLEVLEWSGELLRNSNKPEDIMGYAKLLYKKGNIEESLILAKKAISLGNKDEKYRFTESFKLMEKGEKL